MAYSLEWWKYLRATLSHCHFTLMHAHNPEISIILHICLSDSNSFPRCCRCRRLGRSTGKTNSAFTIACYRRIKNTYKKNFIRYCIASFRVCVYISSVPFHFSQKHNFGKMAWNAWFATAILLLPLLPLMVPVPRICAFYRQIMIRLNGNGNNNSISSTHRPVGIIMQLQCFIHRYYCVIHAHFIIRVHTLAHCVECEWAKGNHLIFEYVTRSWLCSSMRVHQLNWKQPDGTLLLNSLTLSYRNMHYYFRLRFIFAIL